MSRILTRRVVLTGAAAGMGTLLSGCDQLGQSERFKAVLRAGEQGNYAVQRLLQDRTALAQEFRPDQRSPIFRGNGTQVPGGDYARHMANGFADWRVPVEGLVDHPQAYSLAQLRAMPARSQITRHDCVEGWSAIGKWTGVPLKLLLDRAGVSARARYVVFHCADAKAQGARYYESIDLIDAIHPQTILAWALNDELLPVQNGAPLRLRVERQLGYKHAKYVQRIELVDSLTGLFGGRGGYWEDRIGYEWYAGI
ncbi:molybdopterin-binding protein [Nostoc sp. 3335mG]|nr:molybdopterin-binding protein [Nostoc sp. 3335mG]